VQRVELPVKRVHFLEWSIFLTRALFSIDCQYLVLNEIKEHTNKKISAETAKEYNDLRNRYPGFFNVVEVSLFNSFITQTYTYLIAKKDKRSLKKLINSLQANGALDLTQDMSKLEQKYKTVLDAVSLYRHKVVAHDDNIDITDKDFPSVNIVEAFLDDYLEILNRIIIHFDGSTVYFLERDARQSRNDTRGVFDALLTERFGKERSVAMRRRYISRYSSWSKR
jgi:hypothetical protein